MSKYVKDLISQELVNRLDGTEECVIANVIGLDANSTSALRKRLRDKDIRVAVVKNSLARRATEGTPLAPAFEGLTGPAAVLWGGEDFITLIKEAVELDKSEEFEEFEARGGVMDGETLDSARVKEISKWPNRVEQLSILSGQLLSPGAQLSAQMLGPGSQLCGQIKSKGEGDE